MQIETEIEREVERKTEIDQVRMEWIGSYLIKIPLILAL